ncbi:MAG: IS5 family transposase [Clostridia bacterium]|nr:IS5 family transposase [Clostridia bacterium]
MYKRKLNQVSVFDNPAMFGGIGLNPENEWVKLAKIIPWWVFEKKYAELFQSNMGQPACSLRQALGSQIIKEKYQFSDEMTVEHIVMNPYLQYFIGLTEYRQTAPFDPSMMSRFRQRLTVKMMQDVNDVITGRKTAEQIAAELEDHDEGHDDDSGEGSGGSGGEGSDSRTKDEPNKGTLILDATCAPQAIRFPTDTSLLNEARQNTEGIIDALHAAGLTDGRKPRTYRIVAKKQYNGFSRSRRKTRRSIRQTRRQQLNYLRRNLKHIDTVIQNHPGEWENALTRWQRERLAVIRTLYAQQREMYESGSPRIDDRIVSLSQPWVRPIVRGKQNAPVEFGAKIGMSDINGFLRIEHLSWDAFNECHTLQDSVEAYRKAYGHYLERVLADTIYRTRDNLRYCKEHGIHLNGPRLGKPSKDSAIRKQELHLEWLESGERGDIERRFGIGKRCYSLGRITAKLKHTSEIMIHMSVLALNLQKRLRLLLRFVFAFYGRFADRLTCA